MPVSNVSLNTNINNLKQATRLPVSSDYSKDNVYESEDASSYTTQNSESAKAIVSFALSDIALREAIQNKALCGNLKIQSLNIKHNARAKILNPVKRLFAKANNSYDEIMQLARQWQKTGHKNIYDEYGAKKVSFEYKNTPDGKCLKDGRFAIREFDENGEIKRYTVSNDSTKTWTIYEYSKGKIDVYKVSSDFEVNKIFKGIRKNSDGTIDADGVISKVKDGTLVYVNVKGLSSLDDNFNIKSAGQYLNFNTDDNIVDFVCNLEQDGDFITGAGEWFHFAYEDYKDENEIIIDFGSDNEKIYRYDETSKQFELVQQNTLVSV